MTDSLLRRALQGNGTFSGLTGLALALAPDPIAGFLGLSGSPASLILRIIGINLLVFSGALFWMSFQKQVPRMLAFTASVLDAGWVVGSIPLLVTNLVPMSTTGKIVVAGVAVVVALCGVLQYVGLQKQAG